MAGVALMVLRCIDGLEHFAWKPCHKRSCFLALLHLITHHGICFSGPPGPPGVVIVEEITETTATLSWSPGADNHSPILYYNLQARSPFSLGWQTVKTGRLDSHLKRSKCHKK